MKATHTSTIHAQCPVDDRWDYYEVIVTASQVIDVAIIEDVLEAVRGTKAFQEDIATHISEQLPEADSVTLVGVHGKQTKTTVTA